MKKLVILPLILIIIFSCKKSAENDLTWARSFGPGEAFFIKASRDSGFFGCGKLDGKPYLVKLSRDAVLEMEYSGSRDGLFSSAWYDGSFFIAAGSEDGKMLLARVGNDGVMAWDTALAGSTTIDIASLCNDGPGQFLAVGSVNPDASAATATNILLVRFDTAGNLIDRKEITGTSFTSVTDAAIDSEGNILLAMARKTGSAKTRATVMKYTSDVEKSWETDMYNNPQVASACRGIITDAGGNSYVTGSIEVARAEGTLDNSFLASISPAGAINWKRYIENSNSGSDLVMSDADLLVMLNRNCFIVSMAQASNGADMGSVRMYSVCDSYTTDALGYHIDITGRGDILAAGSMSGNYYMALKSSSR